MIKKIVVSGLVASSLTACAGGYAGQGYAPVIDTYGSPGKNPAAYSSDLAQCQALSQQRSQVTDAARGGAVGSVVGAAGGALIGAMRGNGNALSGAGFGALTGLLAGGAYSGLQSNDEKQRIVMNCMQNRGWVVVGR